MKITETDFPGLLIIEPKVFADSRGYFFESFREDILQQFNAKYNWIQENESMSNYGVIRGLHYQLNPFSQAKLVRVIAGEVLDVVMDIRRGSPTFGKKFEIILSGENKKQLLIPEGFAHGFSVLKDATIFSYKCNNVYNKESERGINLLDKALSIDWQVDSSKSIISDKDRQNPDFINADYNFEFAG
jgi:dTDP-4-dehydrorhamnose 3,5-epimerase